MATAVATATTVVITWTCAAKVRMQANVDMPEYGLTKDQVFYLVRSSADDGTYYLLTWSYDEKQWQCPCKWSVEKPHGHQCRHRRLVSADCKARKKACKAAAERVEQALDILAEERKETAKALRKQEGLVQAPNGQWMTPEQLANVPGASRDAYESARKQSGYGDGVQEIVNRLSRAGLMA